MTYESLATPSKNNRRKLDEFTSKFPVSDVKFMLALNMKLDLDECVEAALDSTERMQKFAQNGYSTKGIPELESAYKKVEVISLGNS